MRRMHRLPTQGQLRRLCTVSQRQVTSNMQTAAMREVDRKEGEWLALFHFKDTTFSVFYGMLQRSMKEEDKCIGIRARE